MAQLNFNLHGTAFEDSSRQVNIEPMHMIMPHSEFSVDAFLFEDSTRQLIKPDHIMPIMPVEEEASKAVIDSMAHYTHIIPMSPSPQEEQNGPAGDAPENLSVLSCILEDASDPLHAFQEYERYFFSVKSRSYCAILPALQEEQEEQASDAQENLLALKCIMEDSCDPLHAFQEGELYFFGVNSGSDSDVPEDELTDEMEDTSSDEHQLVPVSLQGESKLGSDFFKDELTDEVEDTHSDKDLLVLMKLQQDHDQQGIKMQEQEMVVIDFLDTIMAKKLAQDKARLFKSSTEQVGDVDTFQKIRHRHLNDISCSDGSYCPDQLNNETMEDISKVPAFDMSNTNSNTNDISTFGPILESAYTQEPYQLLDPPSQDMLSRSLDGALKFTMVDLNIITTNFSKSLTVGQGGCGSVYWGHLKDGTMVAVKRIKKNDKNVLKIEDAKDFQTKVDALYKNNHLNLVKLLGFMEDENELILVTEYVANGNLRQHLNGVPHGIILDMSKRCRISLDVVGALKHLHNQSKDDLDIIHRNIKSSDILITNDFRALVAGFGLSQQSPIGDDASSNSTLMKGTLEHIAQDHSTTHHSKEQNDVHSFGELLVEIFTGQCFVESSLPGDECFTSIRVFKQCAEGRLMDIIDPKIIPTPLNLKTLEQIFKLAASCLVLEDINRPTVEDVLGTLSIIVGHYFADLKDESSSKGDKYEVQKQQKWDHEGCIEPNFQTLCLEESKASKRQGPTKYLNKIDSRNPSFMPIELDGSSFIEGFKSRKFRLSTQLDTELEVDSKQAASQAIKQLVIKEDKISLSFIDIIPDEFQLKSDEKYFEMLQEKITKLSYISSLLSEGDEFQLNSTNIGKTNFFLYFNEMDDVFEFYFKNYQGMASIVGVGLECAKVVLEDGWRVTIQEISKSNWDDAWKNLDSSSSTMKITISNPLEESMVNTEDSQVPLTSIPRGQCLLLDLAQYFLLKMAISSFLPRASMTHTNIGSGASSSSSNQDIVRSSFSSDKKISILQSLKNLFFSEEASNQLKTKNGDGPPEDPPNNDDVKLDTTVHLRLLPGGDLYDKNDQLVDATILDDELKRLTSQLDNTIYCEMMFKFKIKDGIKRIEVIVGPISFHFQVKNEINYKSTKRFGWYHKLLEVSFGPITARDSRLGSNHSALDIVKAKKTITIGSSDATTRGISKSLNGGVQVKFPQFLRLSGGGSEEWSTTKCVSDNVGYAIEKEFEETRGGFEISSNPNLFSSILQYTYCAPDYMRELDHEKLPCEDYRKFFLNTNPICIPQDVKFEGIWEPRDLESNPQVVAEYSLCTFREVHMTKKEISEKIERSSCFSMKIEKQEESNESLKYTQKYAKSLFLNHAMTHLNGKKFRVEEVLSQETLNERDLETHLEDRSSFAPLWHANPLIGLDS